MMRVALVTSGFPPEVGGIEAYVHHLAAHLAVRGCDVDVLTQRPRGAAFPDPSDASGSDVRVLGFPDVTGTRRFRVAPSLWRYLRRRGDDYDVIHAHNFHAFPGLAAALGTRRPLLFTPYYHGAGHTPAAKAMHLVYDRLAGKIFSRSSSVLCISEAESALVMRDYPEAGPRVHQVGIGIESESITGAVPFGADRPVVLVTGRLEAYKRVGLAVEAFALCEIDADMVIIGRGPEAPHIAARIGQLGLAQRVHMLDHVDDVSLRRWQRTATVALSLSEAESFGLGVAEARVAGATVVASDITAHREVAAMSGGAFELVATSAGAREVAGALTRSLMAPPPAENARPSFPTWHEVSGRVLDFYEKALVTSPV